MSKFRAGKGGRTTVSSTTMTNSEWSCTHQGDNLDTTNFESNGFQEGIIGIQRLDWSVKATWNAAQNPMDDPPGLYPRDDGSSMYLYTNRTDAKSFSMPLFRCVSSTIRATATAKVEFDSSGSSQGGFSIPAGSV